VDSFGSWLGVVGLAVACSPVERLGDPAALNSRYTDEQPALSGNRRFLAFVSNRNGSRNILMYDLQQQHLISLPRLNRRDNFPAPVLATQDATLLILPVTRQKP